jgi:hypothetical protein
MFMASPLILFDPTFPAIEEIAAMAIAGALKQL